MSRVPVALFWLADGSFVHANVTDAARMLEAGYSADPIAPAPRTELVELPGELHPADPGRRLPGRRVEREVAPKPVPTTVRLHVVLEAPAGPRMRPRRATKRPDPFGREAFLHPEPVD